MVLERKMFHITQVGFVLLTLVLASGIFLFTEFFLVPRTWIRLSFPLWLGLSISFYYGGIINKVGVGDVSSGLTVVAPSCSQWATSVVVYFSNYSLIKDCFSGLCLDHVVDYYFSCYGSRFCLVRWFRNRHDDT